jgi:hypothetical protein
MHLNLSFSWSARQSAIHFESNSLEMTIAARNGGIYRGMTILWEDGQFGKDLHDLWEERQKTE